MSAIRVRRFYVGLVTDGAYLILCFERRKWYWGREQRALGGYLRSMHFGHDAVRRKYRALEDGA